MLPISYAPIPQLLPIILFNAPLFPYYGGRFYVVFQAALLTVIIWKWEHPFRCWNLKSICLLCFDYVHFNILPEWSLLCQKNMLLILLTPLHGVPHVAGTHASVNPFVGKKQQTLC